MLTSTVDIRNLRPLKKLPPTDANLQLHVLRAHLQMLLWKAADQRDPPEEARNIANAKHNWMSLAVAALQSTRHAVAHAAAATVQAFQARTTENAREEISAVVLSSASRWISKTMKCPSVDDE